MSFKLSMVVSTPEATFKALAIKSSFEQAVRLMGELGFEGVELSIVNPFKFDLRRVKRAIEDYGLDVPALSTGLGYLHYGWDLSSPDPSTREAAVSVVKGHIEVARELGSKVIIGLLRGGVRKGASPARRLRLLHSSLLCCLERAEREGVDLLLEPLNRYETDLINTVDEALSFLEDLRSPRIKLLLDTFHMNIEERDICSSIRKAAGKIGHVHVADSNRLAPGFGHLDFKSILRTLSEAGYNGYLSAEILPRPSPLEAARQTIKHLKSLLT